MRVTKVLLARAARYVNYPRPLFFPYVIELLRERYDFVRVPTTSDEILPKGESSGILGGFEHGRLAHEGRTIVIKSLAFYADAVAIESLASTEEADIVLDDLLAQAPEIISARPNERAYASGLEFTWDVAFESTFRLANALGQAASQFFGSYSADPAPVFLLSGIRISTDPTKGGSEEFLIERRTNAPFEANQYYSHAPLSSPHHFTLLDSAEAAIREALRGSSASPTEPQPPSSQSPSSGES